jgi:gluconate 2-dehydrogenase gamma chain
MPKRKEGRREFVHEVGWFGVGGYLAFAAGCKSKTGSPSVPAPPEPGKLRFFTPLEFQTAAAVAERILPRDQDPGAIDLGVPDYLDRTLAAEDLSQWRDPVREGLERLNKQVKADEGSFFVELDAKKQDKKLLLWQRQGTPADKKFFEIMMWLTFEGAFGDPTYGGNKDGKGFVMIGFMPGPPMPGMDMIHLEEPKEEPKK